MNKKLIIACSVCLLAVTGFVIYTVLDTKKVEGEQTALSNDIKADKEVAETPVSNEKNDNNEYVNGTPDEAVQVNDFFNKCVQYTFNIPDTANIPKEISDFQKENFDEGCLSVMRKFYTGYKSIELINCKVQNIYKTTITNLDGSTISGYGIRYTASIKIQDGSIETAEEDREYVTAIVSYENGKMLLENFDSQTK